MDLLNPKNESTRVFHAGIGLFGQLFLNFDDPIVKTKGHDRIWGFTVGSHQPQVFDNTISDWIPMTVELFQSIPPTFTFAPKPDSVMMELDYFLRGAGLVKHSFVWATESIPVDTYAKVRSVTNQQFRGRYTVTPWFPPIQTLGRQVGDDYIIADEDWDKMFEKIT